MTPNAQLEFLRRATTDIISEADLLSKLESGRKLRVKLGVDPTVAHVTLGWAVVLRKLRDFQRLGHTACLIIGDFTSMIGDPSGKSKTRPQLTREEVEANVKAVSEQVYKVLDPDKTEIYFNRDWLGKMSFEDVIRLASKTTVARILERDDFTKRLAEDRPVALHEILYPLCQAYDSVEIKADIELGGNDQMFNNLLGRNLMSHFGLEPQVVMLSPLLIGTDGKEKMSQSLGNYISIIDDANTMFGKTMSIPDELLTNWFELVTDVPMPEVAAMHTAVASGEMNPRDVKIRLAKEIVTLYHNAEAADEAERYFLETFSQKKLPTDIPESTIPESTMFDQMVSVPHLLVELGFCKSNGEAKRLIQGGGVTLNSEKLGPDQLRVAPEALRGQVLRAGKLNFVKIVEN